MQIYYSLSVNYEGESEFLTSNLNQRLAGENTCEKTPEAVAL
jgi:hypothetical protein